MLVKYNTKDLKAPKSYYDLFTPSDLHQEVAAN